MPTETVENYIKAIYMQCRESPIGAAGVARLARELSVTKGTATSMIQRLARAKLVSAPRYSGVTLTTTGRKMALDVLRRHRVIETFLVSVLKLDWADVHEEAERLEHAFSPQTLDALDDFLGRPSTDPHGDPIPTASGKVRAMRGKSLAAFATDAKVEIVRIMDQDRAFLQFVARSGLKPGARVAIAAVNVDAESISLRQRGRKLLTLSRSAAGKILARPRPRA